MTGVQTTSLCKCGGRIHDGVCGRCLRNEAGVPASPCLTCDCADQHPEGDDVPCEAEQSKAMTCPKSGDPCPMCDANGRQACRRACDEARDLPAVRELQASETVVDYDTFTDACETAHELGRLAGVEDERARIKQIVQAWGHCEPPFDDDDDTWDALLAKIDGGMTDAQ